MLRVYFECHIELRILLGDGSGVRHMTNSWTAAVRWHWYCSSSGCDRYHWNSKVCKMYSIRFYFWSNFISVSFFLPHSTIRMQHIHPFDLVCVKLSARLLLLRLFSSQIPNAVGTHTDTCTIHRQPNFAPQFFSFLLSINFYMLEYLCIYIWFVENQMGLERQTHIKWEREEGEEGE